MKKKRISYRDFSDGDERKMNDLFNLVFQKERPLRSWYLKFKKGPEGSAFVALLAELQDRTQIVGMYPVLFSRFKVFEKEMLFGLPVEIAVHPDFRSFPLIYRITRTAAQRSRDGGVQVGLGFPTERHAFIGVRRLGYDSLGEFPILIRHYRWKIGRGIPFLRKLLNRLFGRALKHYRQAKLRIQSMRIPRDIVTVEVKHFDEAFELFWEKVKDTFKIMRVRNADYLNWKYFINPEEKFKIYSVRSGHEIRGYMALIIKEDGNLRTGYLYDFLSDEKEETVKSLLYQALSYFIREKADCVKCGILKSSLLYHHLLRMGFKKSDKTNYIVYEFMVDMVDEADKELIRNIDHWHVMLSETDWLGW